MLAKNRNRPRVKGTKVSKMKKINKLKYRGIIVTDAPGANAMEELQEHNLEITFTLNYRPVSKIFSVAKPNTRKDKLWTIKNVCHPALRA